MKENKSPFNGLLLDDVHRFEEIIKSENVDISMVTEYLYSDSQTIRLTANINIIGIDKGTKFSTRFSNSYDTFQDAIYQFLKWWDREIARFNSFSNLTQK